MTLVAISERTKKSCNQRENSLVYTIAEIPEAMKEKADSETSKESTRLGKIFLAVAIGRNLIDTIRSQFDPDRRYLA